jgi:uncharacterized OsmC-like protein
MHNGPIGDTRLALSFQPSAFSNREPFLLKEDSFCHQCGETASLIVEDIMEVKIQHLSGVKFEASARGHRVICDQPPDNGGLDTAMTPPEYLLVSLGTCAGFYAAQYLKARSLDSQGLEIKVTAEKVLQPARLDQFRIEVVAPGGLDTRHVEGMLRAVKACLIHNTLINAPAIETVVSVPVEAPAG